jgi:transcriptional regulator with GAF, ATPase, and Fis domain
MIERGVILAEPDGSIDVQHLFAGGEKLRGNALNLGPHGKLISIAPKGGDDAAHLQQRLADGLLEALPCFADIETLLFDRAIERSGGNVSAAARLLQMRRGQVEYRLKRRGLDSNA